MPEEKASVSAGVPGDSSAEIASSSRVQVGFSSRP